MSATLPLNVSSPWTSLGTAVSNALPTTTSYTCQVNAFPPYDAPGNPPMTSAVANNIVNVTAAADSAGSKNSTWWKFYGASDIYGFYVWYNINSAGVDPAPAGLHGIEVDGATNDSAATLATATIAAINADATASQYVVASAGASGHLILTNKQYGAVTAAANGTASYGASFSVTQAGSWGTPAQSGLYFQILLNSTVVASYGPVVPTQKLLSGTAVIAATAADTISVTFGSNSAVDALPNAFKAIINLYQGQ